MKASQLLGKTVISNEEGKTIGELKDFLFDTKDGSIALFKVEVSSGAPFGLGGQARWVRREDVQGLAHKVVTIARESALKSLDNVREQTQNMVSAKATLGHPIITDSGERVGRVKDLEVDDSTGRVTDVVLAGGGGIGTLVGGAAQPSTIPIRSVTSIGPDVVVIPSSEKP